MEREYDAHDLQSVLLYMRQRFGREIFLEPKRMFAILRDMAPALEADSNVLRQLAKRGLLAELEDASVVCDDARTRLAVMKLHTCLTDYLQLSPDRAAYYTTLLLDLYGLPRTIPNRQILPAASGLTGNLSWTLNADGVLTISGAGDMSDYPFASERVDSPWWARRADIQSVNLSDGVTSVGDSAFYGCANLNSVSLPESVARIGEWAFADCARLKAMSLPANLRRIGRGAFSDCKSLVEIDIPGGVGHIESWTFCNCPRLRRVALPDSVSAIGQRAFQGCTLLTHVELPADVWTEDSAFDNSAILTRRARPVIPPPPEPAPVSEPRPSVPAPVSADVPAWFHASAYQKFLLLLFVLVVLLRHGWLTLLLLLAPVGVLLLWDGA